MTPEVPYSLDYLSVAMLETAEQSAQLPIRS